MNGKKLVLVVACALVDTDGRILIAQRPEGKNLAGLWEFPGGKVKEGESVEECIRREIREELGLQVEVERLLPSVRHSYGSYPIVLIPLVCTPKEGEVILTEGSVAECMAEYAAAAEAYEKVWGEDGSPLLLHSRALADKLAAELAQRAPGAFHVALGMTYGPDGDLYVASLETDSPSRSWSRS